MVFVKCPTKEATENINAITQAFRKPRNRKADVTSNDNPINKTNKLEA